MIHAMQCNGVKSTINFWNILTDNNNNSNNTTSSSNIGDNNNIYILCNNVCKQKGFLLMFLWKTKNGAKHKWCLILFSGLLEYKHIHMYVCIYIHLYVNIHTHSCVIYKIELKQNKIIQFLY